MTLTAAASLSRELKMPLTCFNAAVEPAQISSLLEPYAALSERQLAQVSAYLDLLMKWNARTNLTAVRDEENIVSRHFGESFFAARSLLGAPFQPLGLGGFNAIDLGSGAGFPGLPLKIYAPELRLTLIESQNKKATFLKEVVRALELCDVTVFSGRAEDFPDRAALVTLRAVERFAEVLPVAASLVEAGGRLALLIGEPQTKDAQAALPHFSWSAPVYLPGSSQRVLLTGTNPEKQ